MEERSRRETRGGGVEQYHLTLSREILSQCGGWRRTVVVRGGFALERKIGMNISEVGGEGASRD